MHNYTKRCREFLRVKPCGGGEVVKSLLGGAKEVELDTHEVPGVGETL